MEAGDFESGTGARNLQDVGSTKYDDGAIKTHLLVQDTRCAFGGLVSTFLR